MMNIETLQAYPKSHFGPHRANGTLGVKSNVNLSKFEVKIQFWHFFVKTVLNMQ